MLQRLLILLTLALIAGGLLTGGIIFAQVPTATPIPGVTPLAPTVFYITTLVPTPTPGCAAPLNLSIGGTAIVRAGTYVRTQPSESSPWVNYYQDAVTVTVVGGPVCDGMRYNWWEIRGPGNDGWIAEGSPAGYFLRLGEPAPGTVCGEAAALQVGGTAKLLRDVRVRDAAGLGGLVLTVAPAGAEVEVLDGPRCADGYQWWRVRVTVLNVVYTGWIADVGQGLPLVVDVEALNQPVCDFPKGLSIGGRGYVDYEDGRPKNMRIGPGLGYEVAATLLDGIGFEVLSGPVCADGYNWWEIRILSRPDVSGWLADVWITPLRFDKNRPT
jgi:hypothetical protein